jgi:hypothetical protein
VGGGEQLGDGRGAHTCSRSYPLTGARSWPTVMAAGFIVMTDREGNEFCLD